MPDSAERLVVVGAGPAGHTAALYAARAGLRPLLITGRVPGGQLTTTTDVDNWPADVEGVQGPELMERFERHSLRFDARVVRDHILRADFAARPLRLWGEEAEYAAHAVIIATGASAKYLGLPSEQKFLGRGVSACATCDGFFYRGKAVAVVGGGNTAAEEALYLANLASKVYLVHRRDRLRAEDILQKRLFKLADEGKIVFCFNRVLAEALGDDSGVTGARLAKPNGEAAETLQTHGIFIAIGHTPNTAEFADAVQTKNGYIVTRGGAQGMATATSAAGVFAAGDAQDSVYRQAVTSAASGCMAALDAKQYLAENGLDAD